MPNKTVLITGCSSGIGRATAAAFLDEEWEVFATAADEASITELADDGCRTDTLDVTSDEDVERVVDRIEAETERLDCVVNNAGFAQYGPLEDVPVERLHEQFDVNVYGPHRLARKALPLMRTQGDGTIINVSSAYGQLATPGAGPYAGSKFALEAMSDTLRAEVADLGLDVVVVQPGPVTTELGRKENLNVADLERTREYEWVYDAIEDATIAADSLPFAIEPETVATVIHDAAAMSDPEPRYPVGQFASLIRYSRYLPDRMRDSIFGIVRRVV